MSTFKGNISLRTEQTPESCVGLAMNFFRPGITSLSQGVAYWDPPEKVVESLGTLANHPSVHRYGPVEGRSELLEALSNKLKIQNKLDKPVYVTSGCNQAYFHVVIATCDPGDEVVLLTPYYFNHYMALQLTNVTPVIVQDFLNKMSFVDETKSILESENDKDIDFVVEKIQAKFTEKTKMLSLVTPGNPFSAVYPEKLLRKLQKVCEDRNIWLVVDETYEDFVFENKTHFSVDGENVVNLFSFSKSYGIAGWRVGYIAFPPALQVPLDKIQDTNPINCTQLSQRVAHACLTEAGKSWVDAKVETLQGNREVIWNAVKHLPGLIRTSGGLYFLVKLPNGVSDIEAVEYLSKVSNVLVLPCGGCGVEGYIRVSYGNLTYDKCVQAAQQLKDGLDAIATGKWKQ